MGNAERAEALFISDLQPSQHPTPDQVANAIEAGLRQWGSAGCAAAAAAEYGEHPETAPTRMRWALQLLTLTLPPHHGSAAVARPEAEYLGPRKVAVTLVGTRPS